MEKPLKYAGKGDKWRKTDFKRYWSASYWQKREEKLKENNKEKTDG